MIPKSMQAARVHKRGEAVFQIDELPTPTPGSGQVLIRVESAGVNFSDVKRRRGDAYPFETEFPFVPGGEIAGTVEAHGPGVQAPPVGRRVLALAGANGSGGYAEYAVAYAATAVPLPDALSFDVASVLLVAGSTAKVMLSHAARLQPGESVLIPAATGGVGSFAVQVARQLGAGKIIAAVGDAAKRARAMELGADAIVVYASSGWPEEVRSLTDGKGVDVAREASGGATLMETQGCLASFGRLVVYGAASGVSATFDAAAIDRLLYAPAPNHSLVGFNIGGWFMERPQVVRSGEYGAMGTSLGGGNTTRLMAAEPRIKVGVACSGISPQSTNIYRIVDKQRAARAQFDAIVKKTGRVPYEITDILALCAPRPLMLTDSFDDPYNPDITATFSAVRNAWMVWHLLGAPERVSLLIHGDGHDTVDDVRDAGYRWMERWLPAIRPTAEGNASPPITSTP